MPTFAHDGFNIFYDRSGDGPRLLFAAGSGASIATMEPMLDGFRRRFDVAIHDQRGLGRTGLRTSDGVGNHEHGLGRTGLRTSDSGEEKWEMSEYAADALAFADHLGWDEFALVGISFGGMVAQEVAVRAPNRITRLALLCTSAGGDGGSSFPLHTLGDRPIDEQRDLALRLTDGRFTPEWLEAHPSDRVLVNQRRLGNAPLPSNTEQIGEQRQLDARSRHDVWDRLHAIACPTLVASGRYDMMAPPDNGRAIVSRISNAEFRLYEGGHAFLAQDPTARRDVSAFLAGAPLAT